MYRESKYYHKRAIVLSLLSTALILIFSSLASAVQISPQYPDGLTFNVSQSIELNATVTDGDGISTVLANITYPNNTVLELTLTSQGSNKYNVSFGVPQLPGAYTFLVWANDTLGNAATNSSNFTAIFSSPANIPGLQLWLDATDNATLFTNTGCTTGVSADLDEVLCWRSKSNDASNITVESGKNGAKFRSNVSETISGSTVLRFNKSNESVYASGIDIRANTTEDVTIFTVYRPRTNDTSDQGQAPWGNDDGSWDRFYYSLFSYNAGLGTDGVDDGLISLGGASSGLVVDGAGIVDKVFLLTAMYDGNVSGGTNVGPTNASAIYFDGELQVAFTDESHATAAKTEMFIGRDGDNGYYDGDLAEMIVYNGTMNACQLEMVNKWLSARYGKDFFNISSNYGFSSPHDHDVNGISEVNGNCTSTVEITSAQSSIANLSSPTSLDLNDSLTFAHDEGGLSFATDAPGGFTNRLNQSWRVDEDNEPGNVSVSFDLSTTTISVSSSDLALIIDNDTDFSDATIHLEGLSTNGNTVTFTQVNFSDGDYFSLAVDEHFTDPRNLTNLRAWYDATDNDTLYTNEACTTKVSSDGDDIRCWQDKSNYSANATNVSGKGIPTFITNEFNGLSVLNFSKSESDALRHVVPSQYTSDFTIFIVMQSKGNASTYDSFFSNGEPASTDHFQIDYTSTGNSFRYGASAKFNFENYSNDIKLYSVTHNSSHVFLYNEGTEVNNGTTTEGRIFEHYRINQNRNGNQHHHSKISEIILYSRALTICELEKVNIYLGEKYGRDFFGLGDNYGYTSPHDHDINGIGEFTSSCSGTKEFTSAQSSLVTILNASSLNLDDSLTFAHDEGGVTFSTQVPSGYTNRLNQSWRVDEDNEPGNVSVSFDLSSTSVSLLTSNFALLVHNETNFSEATVYTPSYEVSGSTVIFHNINFSDGQYFALAFNEKVPLISFADPTLADGTVHNESTFVINLTSSGFGDDHYTFVNFDNSLLMWLRMDDVNSSGDPTDASGNGNNGTLVGNALINETGRYGNAAHFDGNGDYINLPASNSLIENSGAWTISAWFNAKSIASESLGNRIITVRNASGLSAAAFALGHDDKLQFFYRNTTGSGKTQNITTITTNTWYHYAVTYNGSASKVYINGVLNSTFFDTIVSTSSDTARIGANPSGSSQYFNGSVDEFLILNHQITDQEILSLYNATANQYVTNTTTLADGDHNVTGYTVSINGQQNQTETRTITIDTVSPNATLISPVNATFTNVTSQNLTVNSTDNLNLVNATLFVYNSTNHLINQTLSIISGTQHLLGTVYDFVEGVFRWFYRVVDTAGNTFDTANNTLTIDITAPSVTAIVPVNETQFNEADTIELAATVVDDLAVDTVRANVTYPNGTFALITLTDAGGNKYNTSITIQAVRGSFTLSILANDTAGNNNHSESSTFTHLVPYPGSIKDNITLWLDAAKADTLYQSSCSGTQSQDTNATGCWQDRSSNEYNVTASGTERPTLYTQGSQTINFNPALSFDGTNDFLEDANGENYINGVSQHSTFVVVDAVSAAHDGYIFNAENGSEAESPWGLRFDDAGALSGRDNTFKTGINNGSIQLYEGDEDNITSADPLLASIHWQSNQAPTLFVNGKSIALHTSVTKSGSLTSADYVRLGHESNQNFWSGTIAELIYYQTRLNATAQQQVESYLAVKYGLTLNETVNYLRSDGQVIYNSTGTQQGYTFDIVGIGRDDDSDLNQTKSQSVNDDALLTLQNASSLDNNDFIIVGNNDGSLSEVIQGRPVGVQNLLGRIWKTQVTGSPGTFTLSFNVSSLTLNGTSINDFHLVRDSVDNNFSSGAQVYAADSFANSIVTFHDVSFSSEEFFTLATKNDTSAPNVTNLNVSPNATYNLSSTFVITVNVSDNVVVDTVRVNLTLPNATVHQISLSPTAGTGYNATYTSPGLIGNYTVLLITNDTAGNVNNSETVSFEVKNSIPTPSGVEINKGNDVTLTSADNKSVVGTATFTDLNGYDHISSVTGYFFLTTKGQLASDNRSDHYTSTCTNNGDGSGNTVSYNCTFNVSHYAIPTDTGSNQSSNNWTFVIAPLDDESTGTNGSDIIDMNTLLSFVLNPSSIDFGSLNLGQNTTNINQQINVTNNGNVGVDILLSGTNFSCASGTIPITFLEYENDPFTYGVGTDLLETGIELDLDAHPGNQTTVQPLRTTYYGLGSPSTSVGGNCNGTIVITGQSDPHND